MDVFTSIIIFVVFVILFSICGCWCCKRKREGTVYGFGPATQVTISTQPVHASPVVNPPYPVDPRHPMPNAGAPAPGFHPPASTTPYPPHQAPGYYYPPQMPPMMAAYPPGPVTPYPPPGHAPYPPPGHPPYIPAGPTPYPPAPGASHQQPPPYDVAVGQGPPYAPPPPRQEGYAKQAPYNPHYQG